MPVIITGPGNKCIDINDANTANRTQLILWGQNGGNNQKWELSRDKLFVIIVSVLDSSKCIDIEGGLPLMGAHIVLMEKNGADSQKWIIDTDGHITSFLDPNMRISAGGAILGSGVTNGFPLVLWDKRDTKDAGQQWQMVGITLPLLHINLSYKILAHPVSGALPNPNMSANIHSAVQQMNDLCAALFTNFRFTLLEEPVVIGGPNASGHVNFWYNTQVMNNDHIRSFDTTAKLFYDVNAKFGHNNVFAWRDNAVNIYLTGTGWGGFSSPPKTGDIVTICTDADYKGAIQIHEIGHYFGLPHTHEEDRIADTLIDNKDWTQDIIARNNFNKPYDNTILTPGEIKLVDDTWNNIMSYHSNTHPVSILTTGQLSRWDSVLRSERSNVIHV